MTFPSRRSVRLLTGIGLVLVGLLAGILTMLVVEDDAPPRPAARIVKQVDDQPRVRRARTASDTGTGGAAATPATLGDRFRNVADQVRNAVVSVRVRSGSGGQAPEEFFNGPPRKQNLGSGVIISPDGYIVTNNHVVEGAEAIQVRLTDKRQFEAQVVGTNTATDLAVIKIDGSTDFPVLPIGNSERVEVGDWVVAIGNPFRLTSTVTAGIVSALGRQLRIIDSNFGIENFIQTDAAINPGNSGGALVNLDGELVGINTAIASRTGAYAGYGFAIPSALVERVVTDLVEYGELRRGYLGVSIQEVDADLAAEVGLEEIHGVYVAGVRGGSAADQAGLREGDVVEAVEGERVDATNELQSAVAMHRPGDVISLRVWREGAVDTFDVTLMGEDTPAYQDWLSDQRAQPQPGPVPNDERPQSKPNSDSSDSPIVELDRWGVGLRPLRDAEQSTFGVDAGAYVAYVEQGRPAAAAGLPRDVVITALDDTPVDGPADVQSYLSDTGGPVVVQVQRTDGTQAFYEIN
ncbi:MAG: trypsin-like peptidase domain-containing protein [Salinibacter sp.]